MPECGRRPDSLPHPFPLPASTPQTFTMLGSLPEQGAGPQAALPDAAGLIPRTFCHLFSRIAELEGTARPGREVAFTVSCALLELYKEQVCAWVEVAGWVG